MITKFHLTTKYTSTHFFFIDKILLHALFTHKKMNKFKNSNTQFNRFMHNKIKN